MLSGGSRGFDSHAHLHFSHFDQDLEKVLHRALQAGITSVMVPSIDLPSAVKSRDIAGRTGCWSAAAFHPEHLPEEDIEEQWHGLKRVLVSPRTIAVGETGLDYYHKTFPPELQKHWFHKHIDLAAAIGYPLIVHSRGAEEAVLAELPINPSAPVILHCWGGGEEATREAVSRGFYIGIGGPLTYRKNSKLRRIIASVPHDLLLAETDSPFLPPEPFRGRRNEPAFTRYVIERIRELQGGNMSIEGASFKLWENSSRAFLLHPLNRRADIVYEYGDSAYVNLTSRCSNSCSFCIRNSSDGVGGHFLRHREDPSEELVLSTLDSFPVEDYKELVFCGFGEPTFRSSLIVKACKMFSSSALKTRLNTNGLCTSFMEEESVAELLSAVGSVNISLNASGAVEYRRICRPSIEDAWDHLLKFIRLVKSSDVKATVSAVQGSGADISRVASVAERLGLPLRVRGS